MTLKLAFDNFILAKKMQCLTEKSIKNYKEFIIPFMRVIGHNTDVKEITQEDVIQYILSVTERSISISTKGTYIRHLKVFLKWISEECEVIYDVSKIKIPKCAKKNIRVYSNDEIRLIFDSVQTTEVWLTIRNKLMIALMLDSGLRRNEVVNLQRGNIFIDENYISILGKGNKERVVPLGNTSVILLKEYYKMCPYETSFVFCNLDGTQITNNTIKLMISKLSKKLPFEFSAHKLRHNFATNYCLDQTEKYGRVDIYKLMILMGHEDIETTRRYLHMANKIVAAKDHISHLDGVF